MTRQEPNGAHKAPRDLKDPDEVTYGVRIPMPLMKRLIAACKAHGYQRSQVLRAAIESAVKNLEAKKCTLI
jgi:predicted DNA-binding protein